MSYQGWKGWKREDDDGALLDDGRREREKEEGMRPVAPKQHDQMRIKARRIDRTERNISLNCYKLPPSLKKKKSRSQPAG